MLGGAADGRLRIHEGNGDEGGVGRVLLDDGGCSSRYADVVDG